MDSLFNRFKWLRIVLGVILIAAGVTTIILAINNINVISYVIAACCFAYALMLITASFIANPRTPFPMEVLFGGLLIGAGIVLCIQDVPALLQQITLYLVIAMLISLGAVAIIKSIIIICYKDPVINWLIMLICGAIALAGGIVLIFIRNNIPLILISNIPLGAMIAIFGIVLIALGVSKRKTKKKSK